MPTISVHVDDEIFRLVGDLADHLDRSKSWIVGDALQPYLEHHRWMIAETSKALDKVRSGKTQLIDHATAVAEIMAHARPLD